MPDSATQARDAQASRPGPGVTGGARGFLHDLDYSVVQQCIHCGMCLPTCPTYDETGLERNSPRGRIALMRAVADDRMEVTRAFGEEMYYCLGCLACTTACPAGVNYAELFERARAEVERLGVLDHPRRRWVRRLVLGGVFTRPRLLRLLGRLLWLHQASGGQWLFRKLRLTRLLPAWLRELEPMTPPIRPRFSDRLIRPIEQPAGPPRRRVAMLTGCVQDLIYPEINRDTVDVLLANGCTVVTPPLQPCCGSLHAHNGDLANARGLARAMITLFEEERLDAVITNAAGCGSHLKHYDRLLADDPEWRERAAAWSAKVRDISEFLVETGFRAPRGAAADGPGRVTYHEACHLCHGQGITRQPREILKTVPGLELAELAESTWCCGSAGVYNITQPEQAAKLLRRKLERIAAVGPRVVATANPGCLLQLQNGARAAGAAYAVVHPVSLLAAAYRAEPAD